MQLIDFEYAWWGFRGFDIANHFCEYAGFECDYSRYPDRDQAALFMRHYLSEGSAHEPVRPHGHLPAAWRHARLDAAESRLDSRAACLYGHISLFWDEHSIHMAVTETLCIMALHLVLQNLLLLLLLPLHWQCPGLLEPGARPTTSAQVSSQSWDIWNKLLASTYTPQTFAWELEYDCRLVLQEERSIQKTVMEANAFSLASHQFWGVWAILQAKYSPIDFDYMEYSALRWGEYRRQKARFLAELDAFLAEAS